MKWIKCFERMPTESMMCFLKLNGAKFVGSFVPPSTLYFQLDGEDVFIESAEQFKNTEWLDETETHDAFKEEQKQHLVDIMQSDEKDGLYDVSNVDSEEVIKLVDIILDTVTVGENSELFHVTAAARKILEWQKNQLQK